MVTVESFTSYFHGLWASLGAYLYVDASRLAEPDMLVRLTLQAFLLVSSAFFSGSETALFSLSRLDLQQLRKRRHPQSENLHALLDQPRRLIISILCGNELVNVAAAANMTGILVTLYGGDKAGWISVLIMVPLLLLFGEVTPKTIAVSDPVRITTRVVSAPMTNWVRVVAPLRWVIRGVADRVTTLLVGMEKTADNILNVDEFRSLVEEVANEGELNATERALINNLLEAGDTEIVEIMTPRTRMKFFNDKMNLSEIVVKAREYRHPRVPVFRGHRDNLIGFVHSEDVLRLVLQDADLNTMDIKEILRPPVVVPLTKKVDEMFEYFQENNSRAAVVLNEFGGVEGMVAMEDVLAFIFGQISGDVAGDDLYQERDDNVYEIAGQMRLTDFNNLTNFGIEDPRMTTIGGVAFRHLDHLPRVNDTVSVEGCSIRILEMDEHRIAKVRVRRGTEQEEQDYDPAEPSDDIADQSPPGRVDSIADASPTDESREHRADREVEVECEVEAASDIETEIDSPGGPADATTQEPVAADAGPVPVDEEIDSDSEDVNVAREGRVDPHNDPVPAVAAKAGDMAGG